MFWAALPPAIIIFGIESAALKKAKKIYQELLAEGRLLPLLVFVTMFLVVVFLLLLLVVLFVLFLRFP